MHLNLAAYAFAPLDDLPALRERLRAAGHADDLRGTVLITPEGINLSISGPPEGARRFADLLRTVPGLQALHCKESWSDEPSFNRFLVKIKRETITFRQPDVLPGATPGDRIDAPTLARWLDDGHDDDGRPIALIDTRNAFEVEVGRFAGAIDPQISSFTALPAAIESMRPSLAEHRVVTYCTGGIRCEKAVPWLRANGFADAVQLDGGILTYFEQMGGRHWDGELFVFDRRVSLTPALTPGRWQVDYASRAVHPADDAAAPRPESDAAADATP